MLNFFCNKLPALDSSKLLSHVSAFSVGIYAIFFANYDIPGHHEQNKEHVFSWIRVEMRNYIDHTIYGIKQQQQQPSSSTDNTRPSSPTTQESTK